MYACIIAADVDLSCPPTKPLSLATKDLHDFIEQVCEQCFVSVVYVLVPKLQLYLAATNTMKIVHVHDVG